VLSAASKLPSSSAGAGIARVDVYVNGRPLRSIDARDGGVSSTQVTIGTKGQQAANVDVEAWNGAGRLVAFRRTVIR
jgi:hypothetical protein